MNDTKLIAMYFPQLHSIPENDEWWGKGFTDWNNVRAARPMYAGHYQPRIPLGRKYYDQAKLETIRWQIELAKEYGIYGFCHYHYWFDGRQLLEAPTNIFMSNKDLDFPFCLSWANETWSRRWDGQDHQILIQQTHPPTKESWKRHFSYLIGAWSDSRAIKVNGKPVFAIYRPHRILELDQMLAYWRDLAHEAGLPGLYIIAQKQYEFPNPARLRSFDGVFQFQPFEGSQLISGYSTPQSLLFKKLAKQLPEYLKGVLRTMLQGVRPEKLIFYDYATVWAQIIKVRQEEGLDTYPGAFVDWDNTARYKRRATIYKGACPEAFEGWFERLVETMPSRKLPENFIFLNAWNEWAEGTYLEPDEKYGHRYLEAVKRVLMGKNSGR